MSHYSPACATPAKRAALVNWWEGSPSSTGPTSPTWSSGSCSPASGCSVCVSDSSASRGAVASHVPGDECAELRTNAGGTLGVWFFSLDAARFAPVLVGRSAYRLRYCWSKISITRSGATITYDTHRRWPVPGAP